MRFLKRLLLILLVETSIMPFSEGSLPYTVSREKKLSIPFLKGLLLMLSAEKRFIGLSLKVCTL